VSGLDGRRVVVTRAAAQAAPLVALLEAAGAVPVVVPLIEVVDEPAEMSRLATLDLVAFDWVIATSPNGAERLRRGLADTSSPHPRRAAVGSATAKALPGCDLVAAQQSAVGLLAQMPSSPGRVLVVQAVDAAPTLVEGLRAAGAAVEVVTPYRSISVRPDARLQLKALAADAVLFASGSAARGWVAVFGASTPPLTVAIGPQTADDARQLGLKIDLVATDHSLSGLVDVLNQHFVNRY
jgi:uroporphyrinogen-III synthase